MLALSDGLSLRISRLSLTRSSELKEEEDKMVKSSGETGCPVSQMSQCHSATMSQHPVTSL